MNSVGPTREDLLLLVGDREWQLYKFRQLIQQLQEELAETREKLREADVKLELADADFRLRRRPGSSEG